MDLSEYVATLRKRWRSILITFILTVALATGVSFLISPRYEADVQMLVSAQSGTSGADIFQGTSFTESQLYSLKELATSPVILDPVIDKLHVGMTAEELAKDVSASVPPNTVLLKITVHSEDPDQAARLADAIAAQIASTVQTASPKQADGTATVSVSALSSAVVDRRPVFPDIPLNIAASAVLGLLLGMLVALVREAMDTTVQDEETLARTAHAAALSAIPESSGREATAILTDADPLGPEAEAVRRLRTNIEFVSLAREDRIVVVTSSLPGEGKSTISMNLASSLAEAGQRVLLVDADLRKPSIHRYLGVEGSVGLTTILLGHADLPDVVQPWRDTTLDILPAGQIPPNPNELLGSSAMRDLCARFVEAYDAVVIDSPPLLPVSDAAVLARLCGGAILVARSQRTTKKQVSMSSSMIDQVGAKVHGVVLNRVRGPQSDLYAYRYGSDASHSSRGRRRSRRGGSSRSTGRADQKLPALGTRDARRPASADGESASVGRGRDDWQLPAGNDAASRTPETVWPGSADV